MSPFLPTRYRTIGLLPLVLLASAACRQTPHPSASFDQAAQDPASIETAAGSGSVAHAELSALAGRLVVMAIDASGQRNQALQLDKASGTWQELWVTSPQGNVMDWAPAPDGRSVAYRIIQRSSPEDAVEALVVRDLTPGAPARILAVVDASKERLAGFGWAPDGNSVGFGLQALAPAGTGKGAGWSLRAVTPDGPGTTLGAASDAAETERIWQAPTPPDQPLALVLAAYDPRRSRAAVSELAADSGIIASLHVIDLSERRELTALPVTIAGFTPVAGPAGLALPEGAPLADRLRLLDLVSGEAREILRLPAGASLGKTLWSGDGRHLALATDRDGAAGDETEILVLNPDASATGLQAGSGDESDSRANRRFTVTGTAGAPLAFSPDGRWLLAQTGGPDEAFGSRLTLLPVAGGDPVAAPFTVPSGSWAISWLP